MAPRKKPAQDPPPTNQTVSTTTYPTGSQQGTSTMTQSFEDILNAPVDSFKEPVPTPRGTYSAVIDGPFERGESSAKKTPYVRFKMKLLSAEPDVDEDELAESNAIGRTMNYDLYLTEASAFQFKTFLEHCDINTSGMTLTEALAQTPGASLKVFVEQETTQPRDGSEPRIISRIRRTLAA